MAMTPENEAIAQSVVETYEECIKLLEYVDTLTPDELMAKSMLNALVAIPILGLVQTFVKYTELINKLQTLGGTPTPMESKLVINLASIVSGVFNQIEAKVDEIESNREMQDTDDSLDGIDTNTMAPSGNLH